MARNPTSAGFSVTAPPRGIWQPVEALLPGVYSAFVGAVIEGASGSGAVGVSSWWRSRPENARVGGDPNSQHLLGLAVDIVGGSSNMVLAAKLGATGLIALNEGTHVHAQLYPAGVVRPLINFLRI